MAYVGIKPFLVIGVRISQRLASQRLVFYTEMGTHYIGHPWLRKNRRTPLIPYSKTSIEFQLQTILWFWDLTISSCYQFSGLRHHGVQHSKGTGVNRMYRTRAGSLFEDRPPNMCLQAPKRVRGYASANWKRLPVFSNGQETVTIYHFWSDTNNQANEH